MLNKSKTTLRLKKPPDVKRFWPPPTPPVVLIVEDHEDTRFLIKMLLELRQVTVLEAEDGYQAVKLAESNPLSLILMDGSLPGQDGVTTTRLLRAKCSLKDVPIVFLSGHAEPQYQRLAKDAGCDDFLIKPFEINQIEAVLERQLFHSVARA